MNYLPDTIDPQDVVTTIGLISDTHMPQRWPRLPTAVSQIFADVQMIFHAGDVGELWVLDELSRIAPVVAVHGNDETEDATRELPYQQLVTVAGQRLLIWHSHYANRVDEMHARRGGDLREGLLRNIARAKSAGARLIHFGHWHLPLVFEHDGIVAVNAGAIASGNPYQQQTIQTVALLFVLRDGRCHITHVNLAEPERPYTPQTDIEAGFAGNLAVYGRSILAPDLHFLRKADLSEIYRTDRGAFLSVWLPLAHRVWAGEKPHVELAELLTVVKTADIKEGTRQKIITVLKSESELSN
ncbi:metallophosphoesterase family protein [Candidatus Leptofilum sp.]|uniref:metallophosphoesterase family protein n=1 Tax=Candidatus Leptofilum sp. TaxID=3241576 RepID=UPI003B5C1B52